VGRAFSVYLTGQLLRPEPGPGDGTAHFLAAGFQWVPDERTSFATTVGSEVGGSAPNLGISVTLAKAF